MYHKIKNLFLRDETTKEIDLNVFSNPYFEMLKDIEWIFTEKIDGTNIRIEWDGHQISFKGRTDKAEIPSKLFQYLNETFDDKFESVIEQTFGENKFVLYGEGYGGKIQKGTQHYRKDESFIAFDIAVNDRFINRNDFVGICLKHKISYVSLMTTGTLQEGINYIKHGVENGFLNYHGKEYLEGLVAKPEIDLYDDRGNRIITKILTKDILNQK